MLFQTLDNKNKCIGVLKNIGDNSKNLFDNISRQESLLGRTEYRSFYVYNNTGSGDSIVVPIF